MRGHDIRPNGHDTHPATSKIGDPTCPYCGQKLHGEPGEILARIENTERTRLARLESTLKRQFSREQQQAIAKAKADAEKARKEAVAVIEGKLKMVREAQAGAVAAAVEAERAKSGKAVADAVAATKIEHATEKARLETALSLLQQKLAARPAHQIGEGPETDLFEILAGAFPDDVVARVPRGTKGPDVLVDIALPSGEIAGRVCLDSKAISRWSNRLTVKLRGDQLSTNSDFAVLVSNTFPAGVRELHLQDGVLVVSPARVIAVVTFLRHQIVTNYRLKLSQEQREQKGDRLLVFLTTAEAGDHFDRWAKATDDLISLEAHELDLQTGVHRKRGEMLRTLQRTHEALTGAIDRIIGNNNYPDLEMPK